MVRFAMQQALRAAGGFLASAVSVPHRSHARFVDAHLMRLGLLDTESELTLIGEEFLRCVSDPSLEIEAADT